MSVSFAVHVYNEADALRRLVMSSLPLADLFDEWVIADHRSDDDTPDAICELRPLVEAKGLGFTTFREERDLSADFTFADIRNATLDACTGEIIALHDADFILGHRYRGLLGRSVRELSQPRGVYYGAAYSVPCVWDRLVTDPQGRVVEHGRVWVHQLRDRIFRKGALHYEQVGDGGRWERMVLDDPHRRTRLKLTANRRGPLAPDTLISVNVKPPERIALRDTMTMYMQDAMQGKVSGTWLQEYEAGNCRNQPAYPYQPLSVRGWRLHAPSLDLAA